MSKELAWSRSALECYFGEGAGLTSVLVDGLLGPYVSHEGIRLIGRVPSELSEDMKAYAILAGWDHGSCRSRPADRPRYPDPGCDLRERGRISGCPGATTK
ncbi:hypothetical protein ACFVZW_07540 [Streptomyces sp. NPDC059567]|uniref:hypothetical protein n=1 Tax=Streptomyces sp. NPDC059567 TaxID=3346867 RepID=UPI0036A2E17A